MKKFLAVYLGSESSPKAAEWESLNKKARQERERAGVEAWQKWVMKNKKSIIDMGAPLGRTKQVDAKGVSNTKNLMTAYTIVQAKSHEAAAKLFVDHPHFTIFPGDSVEIIECLPLPGM
jgi:hypothetical protein